MESHETVISASAARTAVCSLLLLLISAVEPASPRGMDAQDRGAVNNGAAYTGVWKAEYQGKTFAVLKLNVADQKLTGTISMGQINVDKDGDVNEVTEEASVETPISDIRRADGTLQFKARDGDDTNQYQMKLTGQESAELKIVQPAPLPEGVPVIRPFKMRKQSDNR